MICRTHDMPRDQVVRVVLPNPPGHPVATYTMGFQAGVLCDAVHFGQVVEGNARRMCLREIAAAVEETVTQAGLHGVQGAPA